MGFRRRAYEPGHKPKILVVIDETPECQRAVLFAARRAKRLGVSIVMLSIFEPEEQQPWRGVGSLFQAEAEAEANAQMDVSEALIRQETGQTSERVIRSGKPAEQVLKLIEDDEDISVLVLAAGTGKEGPGPLVSLISNRFSASFPVPITIVPGGLSDADFEAIA